MALRAHLTFRKTMSEESGDHALAKEETRRLLIKWGIASLADYEKGKITDEQLGGCTNVLEMLYKALVEDNGGGGEGSGGSGGGATS